MSPQRSNRDQLIDGALRCLERLPAERVTARAIAEESGANLASIAYHFGSKDGLVTAAVIDGLDRWLAEIENALSGLDAGTPAERFRRANAVIRRTQRRQAGLVHNFVAAIAKAQHDPVVREQLAVGFRRTRPTVADLLDIGPDRAGVDAAGLVLAMFYGQIIQAQVDPELTFGGERFDRAFRRLLDLGLPL
ncbi:TetR/AcrR family transcriptional regulator [Mycobacterium sp.]|uniref:TetR/AcrR family transcriptional regulator n=1 Tax=Mycobacterium sp. TaxID=1785 RepID=UPI002D870C82|nr:TetR/AcrR family transcriptional regulator [Mycobacterium sp.]